jgi:predicted ATPase
VNPTTSEVYSQRALLMRRNSRSPFLVQVTLARRRVPSYAEYPFCLPAVKCLRTLKLHPSVTFLIGENGVGKSTLLEAIAVAWGFNAEGGSRNFRFSTRSSHSDLYQYLSLTRGSQRPRDGFFLRAESFFNLATEIEHLDSVPAFAPPIIDSYGGRSLHEQSHGESFLTLFLQRFGGNGLYILDEPEAALSPSRQLAVLARLDQLVRLGCQFIIATHSPILMAYPHALMYQLSEEGIKRIRYEDTEHYVVTRRFLEDPSSMLRDLFSEND